MNANGVCANIYTIEFAYFFFMFKDGLVGQMNFLKGLGDQLHISMIYRQTKPFRTGKILSLMD